MIKKLTQLHTPRAIQKIFIFGVVTFYLMGAINTVLMTLQGDAASEGYNLIQLILLGTPLVIAAIVFLTKKKRSLTLDTVFQTFVATFGIVLFVAAAGGLISTVLSALMAAGWTRPDEIRNYDTISIVMNGIVFTIIIAIFVFAIRNARRRGEW